MRPLLRESLIELFLKEVFLLESCLLLKLPGKLVGEENPHSRLNLHYLADI